MSYQLGNWSLIDIETTGIDPSYDAVIDVGFLSFSGTTLVKEYRSLVRTDIELSQFIQKLTGIKPHMLKQAPSWSEVSLEISNLEGHRLLAHNASFEKMFLGNLFSGSSTEFIDSIPYLALLHPGRSSLGLESFMIDYSIAEKEEHRGYEDAKALLQVMLASLYKLQMDPHRYQFTLSQFEKHMPQDYWFLAFLSLDSAQILELANAIGFKLDQTQYRPDLVKNNILQLNSLSPMSHDAFSQKTIEDIFSKEGRIFQQFKNFESRDSQKEMSVRVARSLAQGVHALIQAPTGTGKTLAYLIPSALYQLKTNNQVLVSTGTKALQEQAMQKDIPIMKSVLGLADDFKVAQLIGSGNHLCELLFRRKMEEELDLFSSERPFDLAVAKVYMELIYYNNALNTQSDKLTRLDLPYVLKINNSELRAWEDETKVDFRSCIGNKCPHKNHCSYLNGLREAKEAQMIIGNHALLLTWPKGVPRPAHIIADEAHRIEHEATSAFTLEFSQTNFDNFLKQLQQMQALGALFYLLGFEDGSQYLIDELRKEARSVLEMLYDHFHVLPDQVENYFKKMPKYSDMYWNERPMIDGEKLSDQLSASIYNHLQSIQFILESFLAKLTPINSRFEGVNFENEQKMMAYTRFESFYSHLSDLVVALDAGIRGRANSVASFSFKEGAGFVIQSAPIDVGRIIQKELLEPASAVVFTSATLANADGSMATQGVEWMTGYAYLDPAKRFKTGLYLPPVFNYKEQAKVFVCSDTPNLWESHFTSVIIDRVEKLIEKLGGRTLLLFSSKVRFEQAREILLKKFDGKIPLFIQGMGANVVDEFKKSQGGILLGMESFGEGIDIPGEDLEFILIDKIPDIRQELVIQERRNFYDKTFGNEFSDYFLAGRTRSLHQKIGRLIRTASDRGGAIVVDNRIKNWKSGTLRQFKQLMLPYEIQFTEMDVAVTEIEKFLIKSH